MEQTIDLSSIASIILLTWVIIEFLKNIFQSHSGFGRIPVPLLVVVIAEGLAIAAHFLKEDDGTPYLEGNLIQIIIRALLAALASSGINAWITKGGTSVGNAEPTIKLGSKTMKNIALVLLVGFFVGGCAICPEKAILRESMYQNSQPFHEDALEWGEKLVVSPEHPQARINELPTLTQDQYNAMRSADAQYQDLVKEDRERDAK